MPHCTECWTEFVDGVSRCSDCGGPLTAGPLPDDYPESEAAPAPAADALAAIDTLLGEFPGERAEFLAAALGMEGVHSRLECGDLVQHRGPTVERKGGPIAMTLPVSVFVAGADAERAREVIDSVAADDLVGEEWATAAVESEPAAPAGDVPEGAEPQPEGGRPPVMLLLIAAAVLALYLLRR